LGRHRIRLAISSSNYERFSVNPNNGLPLNQNGTLFVADNTVHHSSPMPSHITLPLVTMAQLPKFEPIYELVHDRQARSLMKAVAGWDQRDTTGLAADDLDLLREGPDGDINADRMPLVQAFSDRFDQMIRRRRTAKL
jgi:hypothetical protein